MKNTKQVLVIAVTLALLAGCGKSDGNAPGYVIQGSPSKTATSTAAIFYRDMMKLFGDIGHFVMPTALATSGIHFGNAVSFKMKFYKIWFSTDNWCGVNNGSGQIPTGTGSVPSGAAPVLVADFGTDGQEFDLAQNPNIASLENIPAGTYNCVIIEGSDRWKMRPDATARAALTGCADDREYVNDILSPGDASHFRTIDGKQGAYPNYGDAPNTLNDDHITTYWPVSNVLYQAESKYETFDVMPGPITLPPSRPLIFYADSSPMTSTHGWNGLTAQYEESGVTDTAHGDWTAIAGHDTCVSVPSMGFR
jgi:hypothetical protein